MKNYIWLLKIIKKKKKSGCHLELCSTFAVIHYALWKKKKKIFLPFVSPQKINILLFLRIFVSVIINTHTCERCTKNSLNASEFLRNFSTLQLLFHNIIINYYSNNNPLTLRCQWLLPFTSKKRILSNFRSKTITAEIFSIIFQRKQSTYFFSISVSITWRISLLTFCLHLLLFFLRSISEAHTPYHYLTV